MCLAAGQRTVEADFTPHSCHCYFLLAGNAEIPILFHVERVRDGRSFSTRTVQARQRGRCIFTLTVSFARMRRMVRAGAEQKTEEEELPTAPAPSPSPSPSAALAVHHAAAMPASRPPLPPADFDDTDSLEQRFLRAFGIDAREQPVIAGPMRIVGGHDAPPHLKKTQQWVRMRGQISAAGGRAAHLNALAYLSDRYFIGTICRIHQLWRLPFSVESVLGEDRSSSSSSNDEGEGTGADGNDGYIRDNPQLWPLIREYVEFEGGGMALEAYRGRPRLGMVVSLDHTVYFHEPERVRADDWMLVEMDSPWAGEGRGVVTQRMFSKDGTLLATCIQEVSFFAKCGLLRVWALKSVANSK